MVLYTVIPGKNAQSSQMTLHVEGKVNSGNWEKLRELCLDALRTSDDLVLNLEKVSDYDFSLGIFVCLLRRSVLLLGKRLTVQGSQDGSFCVFEAARENVANRCSFTGATTCCLHENLFTQAVID
jgi:anti-anti-sigma regulatory factor